MALRFNTKHLPASLQKPTQKYDFKALVRQMTDPSKLPLVLVAASSELFRLC